MEHGGRIIKKIALFAVVEPALPAIKSLATQPKPLPATQREEYLKDGREVAIITLVNDGLEQVSARAKICGGCLFFTCSVLKS
jgi:hypothetical protein